MYKYFWSAIVLLGIFLRKNIFAINETEIKLQSPENMSRIISQGRAHARKNNVIILKLPYCKILVVLEQRIFLSRDSSQGIRVS
jgi:hypothetical protein